MTRTKLLKNMDEAVMVMSVAFRGLVDAVQSNSNVINACAATRDAMARYRDSIDAMEEARKTPSLWDRFKSKDLLEKNREEASKGLVAARKKLAEMRSYLANVQASAASLC